MLYLDDHLRYMISSILLVLKVKVIIMVTIMMIPIALVRNWEYSGNTAAFKSNDGFVVASSGVNFLIVFISPG